MLKKSFINPSFNDKRLNKRFEIICEAFQQKPLPLISQVFQDFHQSKAAYRFFNNSLVNKDKILMAHHNAIKTILEENSMILEIQDTTELDFTNHFKTEGKGKLGDKKSRRKGFLCHTSLLLQMAAQLELVL